MKAETLSLALGLFSFIALSPAMALTITDTWTGKITAPDRTRTGIDTAGFFGSAGASLVGDPFNLVDFSGFFQLREQRTDIFTQSGFVPTTYSIAVSATPPPASLPLFASALGLGGLLLWRKRSKVVLQQRVPELGCASSSERRPRS
jgi:MYXO-CTERM domain-containing protein